MLSATTHIHKEDIEAVVASVFATMIGLETWPSSSPCPGFDGLMTATVYLTGEWQGAVRIHFADRQACQFAGRFVGIPTPESVDDDVRDVMGELANMVAGNLKCTFAPGIRLSIPTVTDGSDYNVRICGGHLVCETAFGTEDGPLWVTLLDTDRALA